MKEAWPLHDLACERGHSSYIDPETGYHVFTALGLRRRGRCCGSGCRHCPYAHANVPLARRTQVAKQATVLSRTELPETPADLLFWSGGKDSFLAYCALRDSGVNEIVLMTTYDAGSGRIANQEVPIEAIARQADHLGVALVGVPLHPRVPYNTLVEPGIRMVPAARRIVFGDLHLEHIREWREANFKAISEELDAPLHFPLWHVEYDDLFLRLEESGVTCSISAVTEAAEGHVTVGETFGRSLAASLPKTIDRFGENGEFHTLVRF